MKEIKFYKVAIFINALVPLALVGWDWLHGRLGADPLNFVTRTTGTLTLVFLMLTLAVTPARKITGVQWLIRFRRMLGLYAFFYGFLHFTAYVWFDKFFNLRAAAEDVWRRPFIIVGLTSFFLMVPLAITSTNGMIKRLGGKRWQRLHKLVYLTAIGGVLHFYLLVKSDTRRPVIFGAILAVLLGYRLYVAYSSKLKAKPLSLTQTAPPR
ncbi:MAG: sulfoxide reductase heme-binding subunit YedZ [Acidobacteria bacterium]|nr:sulfoxide reductase heme-binding subunit YedZ [Acidobacteriota bacterium]